MFIPSVNMCSDVPPFTTNGRSIRWTWL